MLLFVFMDCGLRLYAGAALCTSVLRQAMECCTFPPHSALFYNSYDLIVYVTRIYSFFFPSVSSVYSTHPCILMHAVFTHPCGYRHTSGWYTRLLQPLVNRPCVDLPIILPAILTGAINITDAETGFPVASALILCYLWYISCHIHLLLGNGISGKPVPVPIQPYNLLQTFAAFGHWCNFDFSIASSRH